MFHVKRCMHGSGLVWHETCAARSEPGKHSYDAARGVAMAGLAEEPLLITLLALVIIVSLARVAGDVAAHLARVCDAELMRFHMVAKDTDALFWHEYDTQRMKLVGFSVVDELAFRCRRLDVRATSSVVAGLQPGEAICHELERGAYDLVVMGGYNRSTNGHPYAGGAIRTVLARTHVPAIILLSRFASGR